MGLFTVFLSLLCFDDCYLIFHSIVWSPCLYSVCCLLVFVCVATTNEEYPLILFSFEDQKKSFCQKFPLLKALMSKRRNIDELETRALAHRPLLAGKLNS